MSEDALIRYDNLDAIVKARKWGPSELSAATGRSPSQCSDMLRRKKPFGEKIARDFEQKLDLPRGWFDQIHDDDDPSLRGTTTPGGSNAAPVAQERTPMYLGRSDTIHGYEPGVTNWVRAPIVEWARLGVVLFDSNNDWPMEGQLNAATTQPPAGDRFKAVRVPDDSLAPRLARGDMVVIDPDQKHPRMNQVVLVKGPDGGLLLRRFTPLANRGFEVFDATGRTLDSKRHGIVIVGVAIALVPHDL